MDEHDDAPRLSADQPRTTPSEDLLGYAPFAKLVAHSVLRGSPAAGLVVGIYGEWGLGKTTLLNFIAHYAEADAGDQAPVVVRFNPWWFSAREDLLRRFFTEFERAVLKSRARNTKLRDSLQKLGDAVGSVPFSWVAGVGKVMVAATKVGQPADVVELKEAIVQALAAQQMRVIVLVDDIDRLLPAEMVDIFRLVRSVGDFPNVHYVLAFDRAVVVEALSAAGNTNGARYLDKIIQAPFELPRPSTGTLHRLFTRRLEGILSGTDASLLDQNYWSSVFVGAIAPFLRTPRDVTRLLNALSVSYPAVKNEVNPTDFVAVEALRVFVPAAYEVVRSNRDRFVGSLLGFGDRPEENKQFHNQWLSALGAHENTVRTLVTTLFPAVAASLNDGFSSGRVDGSLRRARRVCVEAVHDIYFRYSFERELSRAQFLETLAQRPTEMAPAFGRFADEVLEDGRTMFRAFLEMLRDHLGVGERTNAVVVAPALAALGDRTIAASEAASGLDVRDDFMLILVLTKLLEEVPVDQRYPLALQVIEAGGVSTSARFVVELGRQHGRHGASARAVETLAITAPEDLAKLEVAARTKISRLYAADGIWQAPGHLVLLLDWSRLGGELDMRHAVGARCQDDQNFIDFLEELTQPSVHGRTHIDVGLVDRFLDLDQAVARAEELLKSQDLNSTSVKLLESLRTAYEPVRGERTLEIARKAVLASVLDESRKSAAYPAARTIRTRFESHRHLIDQLVESRQLGVHPAEHYFVTLPGLRCIGKGEEAQRELHVCELLIARLCELYREGGSGEVGIEQLTSHLATVERGVTPAEVGRAAVVLYWLRPSNPVVSGKFRSDGTPQRVGATEDILDLDIRHVDFFRTPR